MGAAVASIVDFSILTPGNGVAATSSLSEVRL
jgi:hypothetical protein